MSEREPGWYEVADTSDGPRTLRQFVTDPTPQWLPDTLPPAFVGPRIYPPGDADGATVIRKLVAALAARTRIYPPGDADEATVERIAEITARYARDEDVGCPEMMAEVRAALAAMPTGPSWDDAVRALRKGDPDDPTLPETAEYWADWLSAHKPADKGRGRE